MAFLAVWYAIRWDIAVSFNSERPMIVDPSSANTTHFFSSRDHFTLLVISSDVNGRRVLIALPLEMWSRYALHWSDGKPAISQALSPPVRHDDVLPA